MYKILIGGLIIVVAFCTHLQSASPSDAIPQIPDAGTVVSTSSAPTSHEDVHVTPTVAHVPVRVRIPALNLNDAVVPVGLTQDGAMDVPPGNTKNVGWYEYGTVPGDIGSAVFDAHVFAAFSKLYKLKAGDDIYVTLMDGREEHFTVEETNVYALGDVPAEALFARADTQRLNLITCEGKLTRDRSTYDHRRIISATLVQ